MTSLAIKETKSLEFSEDKLSFLKRHYAPGATDMEFEHYIGVCKSRGLNPEANHIYFIKFKNNKTGSTNVSHVISIGAYRLIAQRTGVYAGSSEPDFELDSQGTPISCRITVKKIVSGHICEFSGKSYLREQKSLSNSDNMWNKMPFAMLEKCAEAKALRKAFPEDLSDLYLKEEMQQSLGVEEPSQIESLSIFDKNNYGRVKALNKSLAQAGVSESLWSTIGESLHGTPDSELREKFEELVNGFSK